MYERDDSDLLASAGVRFYDLPGNAGVPEGSLPIILRAYAAQ